MEDKIVLFVDDDEKLQKLMNYLFMAKGIKLESALSGEEGLETLKKLRPDVIITDLNMPEMDGIEFCQRVKEDVSLRDIPVIALTASPLPKFEEKMTEAGASEFMGKPFEPKELLEKVLGMMGEDSIDS